MASSSGRSGTPAIFTRVLERQMTLTRSTAMGLNGAISTPHYLASAAGLRVLQDGGNALDACVAACAVLGVVLPQQCGIGGDLFTIIYPRGGAAPVVLNASGRAGSKATLDFVRAAGHAELPDKGPLSIVVPGCVHGWNMALERFGTRELGPLLQPAIGFAEHGYAATVRLAAAIKNGLPTFNPAARAFFAPGGRPWEAGDVIRNPGLAAALHQIADQGPRAMYGGAIGETIGTFVESVGGHFTADDIAAHSSEWGEPVAVDFGGYQVCAVPPNSQAILHLMGLAVLDTLDLGEPHSSRAVHLQLEAMKWAFRSRSLIADPAFTEVPVARLTSREHAAEGRAQLRIDRATAPVAGARSGDTVYLCAADREGNAVSMIQSLRQAFGSGLMVPGLGVMLNDRARDFGMDDDDPNRIAPGKRPRHTLSPAMALRDGKPTFVYGTRGGDSQPFTMLQVGYGLMGFHMDPQEAIDAPRWSIDPPGAAPGDGRLSIESRFSADTLSELEAMGHPIELLADFDDRMNGCGTASVIQIDHERGVFLAGADPRGDGVALAL
jgi:gamma-glutamyltranspeptidase / glutathione hydrolase